MTNNEILIALAELRELVEALRNLRMYDEEYFRCNDCMDDYDSGVIARVILASGRLTK